jgi:selenide,water dikinase
LLSGLNVPVDADVLVGLHTGDDAGVYRLSELLALVQTVDFITPVVDDPYLFGQIAAANALSDVYAMGGKPLTAMNVLCFPSCDVDAADIAAILAGGADKIREAGASLVGGHTVEGPELFYGLSVTGTVHPSKIVSNAGARPGDRLILTKPIGSGMVSTAVKAGMAAQDHARGMAETMATLNRVAAECMLRHRVVAATDVTGFGLAGHALAVARESKVDLLFDWSSVPILPGAGEALGSGLVAGGAYRNRDQWKDRIRTARADAEDVVLLACDPQTSGGLLIACPPGETVSLLAELHDSGVASAAVVGEVTVGTGNLVIT